MMRKVFYWLAVIGLTTSAAIAQDQVVSVYLEPDVNGTVYFQETMKEMNRYEPRPLLDGSGAGQGWFFVNYPANYVGYVPASEVMGKSVQNGSKAYLRPDASSPVLSVIIDGSAAQVRGVRNGWATVYFTGEAPAYFKPETAGSNYTIVASAPAAAAPQPAAAPAPSNEPVLQEVVMQEANLQTPAPASIKPPSASVDRYVEGTLERVSVWDRVWGPDYEYRLIDASGETFAYVVLDESMLFGTVESYWGKQVEIKGVVSKRLGPVNLVIDAGSIRVLH